MIILLTEDEKKIFDVFTNAGVSESVVVLHLMETEGFEIEEYAEDSEEEKDEEDEEPVAEGV